MRKFTKCLMTLGLLLVAGVASAKETTVYSVDYSKMDDKDGAPFWAPDALPSGASIKVEDGLLVINNTSDSGNNWDLQLQIADGVTTTEGLDYKVKITYKTTTAGGVTVALGTWGDGNSVPHYEQSITVSGDFQTMNQDFNSFIRSGSNFVMWQCRSVVGTIYISKVEVIEITPDEPEAATLYGDLEVVSPTMYVKSYGTDLKETTPNASGVYTITDATGDGEDYATQFFIKSPRAFAVGQTFYIEFEYMADNDQAGIGTQTHKDPGQYVIWHCIGDVNFTTSYQKFTKTVDVVSDMNTGQTIAFNMHKNSNNNYKIRNIVLKLPEELGEAVNFTVGSVGWASYSSNKDVNLGTVSGYKAKISGTSVVLSPVTQVPANNAVLIEGAGKHTFEVIPSASAIAENDLKVSDGSVTSDASYSVYTLANLTKGVGFYKVKAGVTVPAGKAYLKVSAPAAPEFLGFEFGDPTSISELNVKSQAEGEYYNLAGQRVAQPTKGLYIVNGKKYIVK